MSKVSEMKAFQAPDGTRWGVEVQLPSYSSALIVFHHPDPNTASKDRYAWLNWRGPEANNVKKNLDPKTVRSALTDTVIASLFARSMLIGRSSHTPSTSPA